MSDKKQDQPTSKPDPETLHTTDPEEHMKGPFSSVVNKIREGAEQNDHPKQEERISEDELTTEDQDQDQTK